MAIQQRRYKVKSLNVSGKNNKIHYYGEIVSDNNFLPGHALELEKDGHLTYIDGAVIGIQNGDKVLRHCRANVSVSDIQRIFSNSKTSTIQVDDAKPELSVVIPYFRAEHIGWIPFESLARQEDVSFEWELIIIEEDFESPFGFNNMKPYFNRLAAVGCVRLKYISINEWMPLSAKWYYLYQGIDQHSKIVACNSADIYMSPNRLSRQYEVLKGGQFNWFKLSGNIVYDIGLDVHVMLKSINKNRPDTCCRAFSAELAKQLPLVAVKKSVDGWSYNTLSKYGIKFYYDESDLWIKTVNINGLNNISLSRQRRIKNVTHPFKECKTPLPEHMPTEVIRRLRKCSEHLNEHKSKIKSSPIKL